MLELLNADEPWEIPLPVTWEDRERLLDARRDGVSVASWEWKNGKWEGAGYGTRLRDSFPAIVKHCMSEGYHLFSVPPDQRSELLP